MAILIALLADFLLAPALMLFLTRKAEKNKKNFTQRR